MKRGLKGPERLAGRADLSTDARITPMKRGLKDGARKEMLADWRGCKDYPDEKGTESSRLSHSW